MPDEVATPFTSDATGEDDDARDEEPLRAEEVGGAASEQEEAAEDEGVRVDDPLQARGREVRARARSSGARR